MKKNSAPEEASPTTKRKSVQLPAASNVNPASRNLHLSPLPSNVAASASPTHNSLLLDSRAGSISPGLWSPVSAQHRGTLLGAVGSGDSLPTAAVALGSNPGAVQPVQRAHTLVGRTPLHPLPKTPSHKLQFANNSPATGGRAATPTTTDFDVGSGTVLSPELDRQLEALFVGYAQDAMALLVLNQAREQAELAKRQQEAAATYEIALKEYEQVKKAELAAKAAAAEKLEESLRSLVLQQQQQQLASAAASPLLGKGGKGAKAAAKKKAKTTTTTTSSNNTAGKKIAGERGSLQLATSLVGGSESPRSQRGASPQSTARCPNREFLSPYPVAVVGNESGSGDGAVEDDDDELTLGLPANAPLTLIQRMLLTSKFKTDNLVVGSITDANSALSVSDPDAPKASMPPALIEAARASQQATVELRRLEQFLLRNRQFPAMTLVERIDRLLALSKIVSVKAQQLYSRLPVGLRTNPILSSITPAKPSEDSVDATEMGNGKVASGHIAALIGALLNLDGMLTTSQSETTANHKTSVASSMPMNSYSFSSPSAGEQPTKGLLQYIPPAYAQLVSSAAAGSSPSSDKPGTALGSHLDALDKCFLTRRRRPSQSGDNDDADDPYLLLRFMGIGSSQEVARAIQHCHPRLNSLSQQFDGEDSLLGTVAGNESTNNFNSSLHIGSTASTHPSMGGITRKKTFSTGGGGGTTTSAIATGITGTLKQDAPVQQGVIRGESAAQFGSHSAARSPKRGPQTVNNARSPVPRRGLVWNTGGGQHCEGACQWCYFRSHEQQEGVMASLLHNAAVASSVDDAPTETASLGSPCSVELSPGNPPDGCRSSNSKHNNVLPPTVVEYDLSNEDDIVAVLGLLPVASPSATYQSLLRRHNPITSPHINPTLGTPSNASLASAPPTMSISPAAARMQPKSRSGSVPPTRGAYAVVEGVEIDLEKLLNAILGGIKLLHTKSAALDRRLEAAKKARCKQEQDLKAEAEALRRELEELRLLSAPTSVSANPMTTPRSLQNTIARSNVADSHHTTIVSMSDTDKQFINTSTAISENVLLMGSGHTAQQHSQPLHTNADLLAAITSNSRTAAGLSQRLEEREQQLKASQLEAHAKEKTIRSLIGQIAERDEKIAILEADLRVEKSEVVVVKKQVKDVSSIRSEEARMSSSAVRQLEDSLADKRAQIVALARAVEVLKKGMGSVVLEWMELEAYQDDAKTLLASLQHEIATLHSVFNPIGLAKEVAELRQSIALEHHTRDEQESALATLRQENDHLKLRGRILKSTAKDIIDRVLTSVEWKLLHARAPEEALNAQDKLLSLLGEADAKDTELVGQLLEKARGFQLKVENEVAAREQRRRFEVAARIHDDFKMGEPLSNGITRMYPSIPVIQLAGRIASGDTTVPSRAVDSLCAHFNTRLLQHDSYGAVFDRQVEAHLGSGAVSEAGPVPLQDMRAPLLSSHHHHQRHGTHGNQASSPAISDTPTTMPCFSVAPVCGAVAAGEIALVPDTVLENEDAETDGAAIAARQLPASAAGDFQRAFYGRIKRRRRRQDTTLAFNLEGGGASQKQTSQNNGNEDGMLEGGGASLITSGGRGGVSGAGGGGGPVRVVINASPAAAVRTTAYRQGKASIFLSQLLALVGSVKAPSPSNARGRGPTSEHNDAAAAADDELATQHRPGGGPPSANYFLPMSSTLSQPLPDELISFAHFIATRRQIEVGR